jgi:hypothetical protein
MGKKHKASELDFISEINRDGKGVTLLNGFIDQYYLSEKFKLRCLSVTQKTYIATDKMNYYVVKIKETNNK